jgi:PAS domain S-box-containing protein
MSPIAGSNPAAPEAPHDPRVGYEQLLALIDNTSAVIYMRDTSGRYMLVNREYERLFNVSRSEIIGRTDYDLFPPQIAHEFHTNDQAALASRSPVSIEEAAPAEDGLHTYITVKFPLLDESGNPYAICGISTDITDRKRAEEKATSLNDELEDRVRERTAELEALARELDAFAYSVSHDLRAPLRALHGFSQILAEDYTAVLDDQGRAYLERIQANAARMAQIIDDLLMLSRAARSDLHRERINLHTISAAVLDELSLGDPDRQVSVNIADDLWAWADPRLIRLGLWNLLGNAWKFTSKTEHPQISVGCLADQDDGGQVTFFIRDNGAGFDPRFISRIFEPFQRLHTIEQFDGSGLGLTIVHRVVQRHGGRIWAESALDEGATFYVTLPNSSLGLGPDHHRRGHDAP